MAHARPVRPAVVRAARLEETEEARLLDTDGCARAPHPMGPAAPWRALAGWPLLLAGSGRSGRAAVENGLLVNGRYIF
jgi:hypothetical protein